MATTFTLEDYDPADSCRSCGEAGTFAVTAAGLLQAARICTGCVTTLAARAAQRNVPAPMTGRKPRASKRNGSGVPATDATGAGTVPVAEFVSTGDTNDNLDQ